MTERRDRWSQTDMTTATEIWQDMIVDLYGDNKPPSEQRIAACRAIAAALHRNFSVVERRLNYHGPNFGWGQRRYNRAPLQIIADREARAQAADLRDLTGLAFNDPPPGYSALDKRGRSGAFRT